MAGHQRILFATDFSEGAQYALEQTVDFAKAFGAQVILVHAEVLHESDPVNTEEQMKSAVPVAAEEFVTERKIVRGISAEHAILHEARESGCDLIALGTHGRSGLKHVMLGSVAERVVQLSDVPVLTIRHPGHAFERP